MNLSPAAQATLLLTSYFTRASKEEAKPLTNTEWGRFALWLKEKAMTPADLLVPDPKHLLNGCQGTHINPERILQLLGRGHSLALAMEKWQRAGLWVITRSDPDYPQRLKARLQTSSPPVLYGCGNKTLLNVGGIAVVGSRNASNADLIFTEQLAAKSASQGLAIVSGGARGVDEAAMLGAAQTGGTVIGVLADSLLKAATTSKWRTALLEGRIVLVSPFYPEAGFSAGNAMARNKYIYSLADTSIVIHTGSKGGTISGAEENIKHNWVPLWVKPTEDKAAANKLLVSKGGRWCPEDVQKIDLNSLLISTPINAQSQPFRQDDQQSDLFSISPKEPAPQPEAKIQEASADFAIETLSETIDFYSLFLIELKRLTVQPKKIAELVEETKLQKSQITLWLKQAVNEGHIKKLNRPVRYQCIEE